ncbi:hypothetical protein RJ55_03672 [Drechmeria coniospora]|nr:hypothetical protein RJ55_03672 [Drechmeria coniospora]
MAAFFQSFRTSSMPKRLLRYALSRLEILDAEALDVENLDFALGRNTVFEFKDVAIKLKRLEKLLKLPATFKLQRAKVLLLRVTIPMDFYTSPIIIEIDGVDVRLAIVGSDAQPPTAPAPQDDADAVPNTVDLAQSFLQTQPSSERKQLEEALVAETHDLAASVSVSDDGSEDEPAYGTGQALSLPDFLAGFLQGIIDRMQISIKGVSFQLDMEVPSDVSVTSIDPVSVQLALETIQVEGVTTTIRTDGEEHRPVSIPKEGKRLVSLANIRAYLILEANVFSVFSRCPSIASPSVTSSPIMTRNPPSRQCSSLSQGSFREQPMVSLQQSFREHLSDEGESFDTKHRLADSEDALGIPYDFYESREADDDSPPTPRLSALHDSVLPDDSLFHSTFNAAPQSSSSGTFREEQMQDALIPETLRLSLGQDPPPPRRMYAEPAESSHGQPQSPTAENTSKTSSSSEASPTADLAESRLYTHEEAESMYMSAFSSAENLPSMASRLVSDAGELGDVTPTSPAMPGAWGDEPEGHMPKRRVPPPMLESETPLPGARQVVASGPESAGSSPAFSKASIARAPAPEPVPSAYEGPHDDFATPKGPTRVAKEILSLKSASIYIPSHHQSVPVQTTSESIAHLSQTLGTSIFPQAPGAFSVHRPAPSVDELTAAQPTSEAVHDGTLEVLLSPLAVSFDASVGFLLAMVFDRLLKAAKDGFPASDNSLHDPQKNPPRAAPEIKVQVEEISLNFLNRLGGVADTSERYLDPSAFIFDQDVLLNATMRNLDVSIAPVALTSTATGCKAPDREAVVTKVGVEKFRFGYASGDLVSFDSERPMSTSVRDTFLSTGHDIGIKMVQTATSTSIDVETLPLVVQIDLQRLDETFGWFGGLSSFLNMNVSKTYPSPTTKSVATPAQRRGVHFETPIDPEDKSATAQNKVNVRIGGALVELVGRDCSVAAETNAIKLVSRDEGIGVACSHIRVSGPYLKNSLAEPAIATEVGGVRLEFLVPPKDRDLEKLLELIIPSKVKFDVGSDEIMVDTLLRQRRKGSVLRVTLETVNVKVRHLGLLSPALPNLAEEIAKLSAVAKYLPEDDRPGLLTLSTLQKVVVGVDVGGRVGHVGAELRDFEIAHISVPSLVAVAVGAVSVRRNKTEELISSPSFDSPTESHDKAPILMARMIGDEMEPTVKLKLYEVRIEYRVPTVMDVLGLAEDATPQDFEAGLAASVASLGDRAQSFIRRPHSPTIGDVKPSKPMTLDVGLRDCLIGLNPLDLTSKMVVALTEAHLQTTLPKDGKTTVTMDINKASILLTDDVSQIGSGAASPEARRLSLSAVSAQVADMCAKGFVNICYISSASVAARVKPATDGSDGKQVEVDLRDDLLVLETCADSTQTLITLANALKPPTPPIKGNKYRTKVVPMQDLLASISAEAFGKPEGEYDFDQDFAGAQEMAGSDSDLGYGNDSLHVESQYYGEGSVAEELFDATSDSGMQDTAEGVLLTGFDRSHSTSSEQDSDGLVIHEDFYGHDESGSSHPPKLWNSNMNTYDEAPESLVVASPLKVSVRDVHVIWNLFDGYDWAHTRDVISKAVEDVEFQATERQSRGGLQAYEEENEDEETIGDFLFNSIYIGIPANRDPRELTRAINEGLNDNTTDTESVATTAFTAVTNKSARRQPRARRLRLNRSKHHKITFELQGLSVDMVTFPSESESETLSSIDVRIQALDIFDHVPTSTWKKFATYDQDQGERELGSSMVHLEILNVRPLPELVAAEIILRATLLPLRLHVDQDALDFITRFFEFKDDKMPVHASPSDIPFVQRAEINDVPVKLDFKPKRVDYAGLRSGHTTEFMNFVVLEESRMVLRHVIIYGVSGFDRLGKTLNDIWMPDVRNNQLPGVVAGLAPVRSLVNIGSGFRDLVEIPLREYQKDGRVIRSISKGAAAFARTTGTELVKLGAKLAVGTQYALQGAEEMLMDKRQDVQGSWEDGDLDAEDRKQISLYADQPTGVLQGLRGGFRSLTRDVNLARDAIIAVPGEVMESQSATGLAKAVWKRAPTIIFRPAVGVTKVFGQTLMGATNSIDPHNRRRIGEKYKH